MTRPEKVVPYSENYYYNGNSTKKFFSDDSKQRYLLYITANYSRCFCYINSNTEARTGLWKANLLKGIHFVVERYISSEKSGLERLRLVVMIECKIL